MTQSFSQYLEKSPFHLFAGLLSGVGLRQYQDSASNIKAHIRSMFRAHRTEFTAPVSGRLGGDFVSIVRDGAGLV